MSHYRSLNAVFEPLNLVIDTLNLGTADLVTIKVLVLLQEKEYGKDLLYFYIPDFLQGQLGKI